VLRQIRLRQRSDLPHLFAHFLRQVPKTDSGEIIDKDTGRGCRRCFRHFQMHQEGPGDGVCVKHVGEKLANVAKFVRLQTVA